MNSSSGASPQVPGPLASKDQHRLQQEKMMNDVPQSTAIPPLTPERCIEILSNFADGTYQAISPDVCRKAAEFLQKSTPDEEPAPDPA